MTAHQLRALRIRSARFFVRRRSLRSFVALYFSPVTGAPLAAARRSYYSGPLAAFCAVDRDEIFARMALVVPRGDDQDPTRLPAFYDQTFEYLARSGMASI